MSHTIWQTLSDQAQTMAHEANRDVASLEEWTRIRPRRHQEFMRSLGLDPLPPRCDLKLEDHGEFGGEGYRARRIAFQLLPECWGSAVIYYPDPLPPAKAPGVLYVCGHGTIGTYHYQYHPMMWARRGYVCLVVDTIEQHDNPGEHHGTVMHRQDEWLALGYTPAGAEVWNAMRALDVLEADPQTDPARLGVTGVSGGGACSFHVAVADDRLKAVSTLCGVSSPLDAITNRHLLGHCDCIYPLNLYRRDTSEFAALIAPRTALFCFADHDALFHAEETRALVERTQRIYRLYGREELCELVACPGPHGDHVAFDDATRRVFDRDVAGEAHPVVPRGEREQPEPVISIFNGRPPDPDYVDLFPRLLCRRGTLALPRTPDEWPALRDDALARLRRDVMPRYESDAARGQAAFELSGRWCWGGNTFMHAHRGTIDGQESWLQYVRRDGERHPLVLGIANEGETSMHALDHVACGIDPARMAYGGFEPRLSGFSSPAPGVKRYPPGAKIAPLRTYLLFAMSLIGTTPILMTYRDIGAAIDYLSGLEDMQDRKIYLHGHGDAGVAALYWAIGDDRISGVILNDIPSSHLDGAPLPGILRLFDLPQAVGLMAPRKTALVTPGHSFWTWPSRVYERLGCPDHFVMVSDTRTAMESIVS